MLKKNPSSSSFRTLRLKKNKINIFARPRLINTYSKQINQSKRLLFSDHDLEYEKIYQEQQLRVNEKES